MHFLLSAMFLIKIRIPIKEFMRYIFLSQSNIPGGGQNSPSAFAEADTCNYSSHIYDTADQSTKTEKESCRKIVVNLGSNKKQLASFQLDHE